MNKQNCRKPSGVIGFENHVGKVVTINCIRY